MSAQESHTFITGEADMLPGEVRAYFDPKVPPPNTVQFFEERVTTGGIAQRIAIGLGLMVVGLVLVVLGIYLWVLPVVGLVFMGTALWILYSVRTAKQSMAAQQAGKHTRYGIYLFGNTLAQVNNFGYTLIPRNEFLGVENGKVKYLYNDAEKSFDLPPQIVGADAAAMHRAIAAWQKSAQES